MDTQEDDFEDRIGRAEIWGRTLDHKEEIVTVVYDKIKHDEYINRVEITEISCTCHDE